jgi:hypothetical protein
VAHGFWKTTLNEELNEVGAHIAREKASISAARAQIGAAGDLASMGADARAALVAQIQREHPALLLELLDAAGAYAVAARERPQRGHTQSFVDSDSAALSKPDYGSDPSTPYMDTNTADFTDPTRVASL